MKNKQVNDVRRKLEQEKKELIEQVSDLEKTGLGNSLRDSIGELSLCDNHPADIGDELFERSKDIALRDNAHILLERVEHALEKIDDGTYGVCDKCQSEIPLARLEAIPSASECIRCQRYDDASDHAGRPIEESVIGEGLTGFDRDDTLEAVMRYGSSDSPQDKKMLNKN